MKDLSIYDTVKDLEFIQKEMNNVKASEIVLSKDKFDNILKHLKAYEKLYIESSWDKSPERMGGC